MMHAPLIIDIAGLALSTSDKQRLSHPLVGGLILFARNWQDRAQLTRLCQQIKAVRKDLLICVDHEGGRVQRFKTDGFTHLPSMAELAQCWDQDAPAQAGSGALRACRKAMAAGYVLASELRACGVDLSFTPVLDLDWGRSAVIGNRSFSGDPRRVSLLAQSLMHGLLQAGMHNCGKHFPGHGYAKADSHVAMAQDTRSKTKILQTDAMPYGQLRHVLSAVMPAHVLYPKVDDKPAGFSSVWLQDVLRQELGFDGLIFSDDLSMAAARQLQGRQLSDCEAATLALKAGCDMVLLCNQSLVQGGAAIDELIEGLSRLMVQGPWPGSEASEARRLSLLPSGPALSWDTLMRHSAYVQALEDVLM
jgi:beta-N-acetylhexosaminidase